MSRCPSCGRRVDGAHPPCGAAPPPRPALPATPLPEVPGYRLRGVLGSGGFATVFAAERQADGRRVALKVARPDAPGATAQLEREAHALRAIGPPAVVALLGEGRLGDGSPFLALELVDAPSLDARLRAAGGALSRAELGPAIIATLDALAAVHAAGWAHGDLKPENVLLTADPPRARLLDLGLSERLAEPATAPALPPGTYAGTAEYMSPELCQGSPPDARSDVYAAGALLLELATGRPPFLGPAAEVRHAHVNLRPPPLATLGPTPPALAQLILRCLAKSPDDRFPSAAALRDALPPHLFASAAQQGRAALPPAAAPSRAVRRSAGVVYLESDADVHRMQAAATALGGVLAHADGRRHALVFDPVAGENPVRLAVRAARNAVASGLAPRALVDLVAVLARPRPGGADRYLAADFSDPASWPAASDPAGALATARAAEVLVGEALEPVPGRDELLVCPPQPAGGNEATTVVRRGAPPLLGRDEVLSRLVELARAAGRDRTPTVAAVLAEPGLGKSHLATALAEQLRGVTAAPFVLELRAGAASEERDALAALLRRLLDVPAAAAAPPDAGRSLLRLALPAEVSEETWPAVALVLGWLAPGSPLLQAAGAAPGALPALAARAAAALLRRRAAVTPVCVVLDDAHTAGGAALDALESAALAEGGAPLFVCALARPGFATSRPYWGERAARRSVERLDPLPPATASELCRQLLAPAEGIPARALEQLATRAQGVPLLLVELVRGLRRDGLVRQNPQGASYLATDELDRVPDLPLVEWLVGTELRAMPPDLASHAQLLALLGDEVSLAEAEGVLAELTGAGLGAAFPLDAAAAVRRLAGRGIVSQHRGGAVSYRLPLVRDAVARSSPDALRAAIHEAALRFHRRPGPFAERLRLLRLAVHAGASGRRPEAADAFLRLAAEQASHHAYVQAEGLYSRALENLPDSNGPERLAALRGRGLMRSRVARHRDAVADLAAAAAAARALGDSAAERDALLDQASALDWMSDFGASRACVERAASLAGDPTAHQQARLALGRGRSLFRASRWAEACAALERAAALAERHGDAGYETLEASLLLLGAALPYLGRAADAEAALERARSAAARRGDLVHVAVAYANRRNLSTARGDLAAVVADQLEAIRIARELGHLDSEYYSEYNLAELHYQVGDLERAAPHLARAEEIERSHPEAAPGPLGLLLRARVRLLEGDLAGARTALERFRDARAAGWSGSEVGPSFAVLADMVDLAARDAPDAAWDALAARSTRDSVEQDPVEVLEMRGRAALRVGRPDVARATLAEALALAQRLPGFLAPRVRAALEAAGGR